MRNFLHRLHAGILLLAILSATIPTTAQTVTWPQRKPFANQYDTYSQMWNAASTGWYYGTITFDAGSGVPNSANYGRQLDSSTGGGTIALSTSRITVGSNSGRYHKDTTILQSIPGYGNLTITSSILLVSGSPTVTATLYSSSDGWVWAPVVGATVMTVIPTSSVTPTVSKWSAIPPLDRFYEVVFDGGGGDDYSAQSWFYYQRIYGINLTK